ncbi:carbon catabolite repressor protein 4 homolog 5 isoform X2 [Camellia sinensis]|uniref:carbon catabolite repressor protein 4 homolog 5 isoform X2 n=1 Tax=Camellia sinensis TaxID=4442 RepID=UPI0010368D3F|nr:carbon catabolite repressor protein 4 homolog 5 isoform X2 [Camellia sinensis]
MRGGEGRVPAAAGQSVSKRRHSQGLQQCHRHTSKKRRLNSETETLTLTTLDAVHTHPTTYKHKKHHHSTKSSSVDRYRKWMFSDRDFSNHKDKVIFVSYNILGVENASKHPDLYSNVPPKFLDWDRRKMLLCKEISQYNASILCFQEVDRFNDLDNLLQKDGFKGIYQARTGEACDGCAIFWKSELFTILHQENMEFQSFGLRNNVAQFCVLKMNQDRSNSCGDTQTARGEVFIHLDKALPSRSLLVGNIHVLFNPNRGDIKLGQIRLFLKKAHKLSQEWGNIPVILAGDLNSMPQSAMYQFLASSELDLQLHDRRRISGQICPLEYQAFHSRNNYAARPLKNRWSNEELMLATGTGGVTHLRHNLKLCSAYLGVHGSCRTRDNYGEPLATSYHSKFMGTVDYIWHTRELVPVRVLETLPVDILRKTGGLPSKNWGSDHLALVCELAFVDDSNER